MQDIDQIDIRRLDMSLLLVFAELLRQRKLTAVAARLGLQQSTISHALKRLRDVFGDPLFLRRPDGVVPTARALALEPLVIEVLALVRAALAPPGGFDPAGVHGTLRISALDYHCALFAAPLIERLQAGAPGLDVSFGARARLAAFEALEADETDIALGFFPRLPEAFAQETLFEETYVVLARQGHPSIRGALSLEQYVAAEHIVVSLEGDLRGVVDAALARQKHARRVRAAVPYFLPALAAVRDCDALCTMPRCLALSHADAFGLQVLPPPLRIRPFRVAAVWLRRGAREGVRQWAVAQLREIAAALQPPAAPRAT